MTIEIINEVKAIFEKHNPVKNDGTFESDKVKETIIETAERLLTDQEKERLITWMEKNEFFTSPASTKYHGNKAGGLAAHSLMVSYQAFCLAPAIMENFSHSYFADKFEINEKDIFLSAICHDFCKAGFYTSKQRRSKDFTGNVKYESYFITKDDNRTLGHGNESVLRFLEIFPEQISNRNVLEAISRHMGFSDLTDTERINYNNFIQNPLVVLIQLADQTSAQWFNI
ncbi:MAG: HD domain-containing protein [Treponemataceae bacterium]|nr:HD domain-containing protein [Treponemataceae bacterium]